MVGELQDDAVTVGMFPQCQSGCTAFQQVVRHRLWMAPGLAAPVFSEARISGWCWRSGR